MLHSQPKIMIVDDSPVEIQALLGALKSDFSTTVATSGERALERLKNLTPLELPNLILLDINMPGIDGYETCEAIKESSKLKDIDILFFSSNDSTEEITKGFDVGASDFITKPFKTELLINKINAALKTQQHRNALASTAKTANSIAMSAMRNSGDLGIILEFLRECFHVHTLNELAQAITQALKNFTFNAAIYIYDEQDNILNSTDGTLNELETTLLHRLKNNSNSLHEHNNRLIISRKGSALLIKNLPPNKEDASRVKDHLMTLMEGISNKLLQLNALKTAKNEHHKKIQLAVVNAHTQLKAIQQKQEGYKKQNMVILDTMVHDVEDSFVAMGLTDTQEEKLLGIMTHAANNALDHLEHGLKLDAQLANVVSELSAIVIDNNKHSVLG